MPQLLALPPDGIPGLSHAPLSSLPLAQPRLRSSLSPLRLLPALSPSPPLGKLARCPARPEETPAEPSFSAGNPLGLRLGCLGDTFGFAGTGATVLALGGSAAERSSPARR